MYVNEVMKLDCMSQILQQNNFRLKRRFILCVFVILCGNVSETLSFPVMCFHDFYLILYKIICSCFFSLMFTEVVYREAHLPSWESGTT